jgi:phage regulator Rha-like protein
MPKTTKLISAVDETILNKIYLIRGKKVMIDRDLAELYEVETKRVKELVRRNPKRFPIDFMFEMNSKEFQNWRTHFATSKEDKQGLRYAPFCFTEQGATMLACTLNSDIAIETSLQIIRIFAKMKEMIATNKDILIQMQKIEKKLTNHDADIKTIFSVLKKLINTPQEPRKRIGFKPDNI